MPFACLFCNNQSCLLRQLGTDLNRDLQELLSRISRKSQTSKSGLHYLPLSKLTSPYRILADQTNRPISLTPWSITMNTFSSNVGNISLWRSIRRVTCPLSDIDLGQLVQQFGGTTFGNSGMAIDHKIII